MDEPIVLDCDQCGTNSVFGLDGLKGDDRIICPACNVEYGFVAELLAIKKAFTKTLQSELGESLEGVEGVKFTKDDNLG
jgi:hypothetical protein